MTPIRKPLPINSVTSSSYWWNLVIFSLPDSKIMQSNGNFVSIMHYSALEPSNILFSSSISVTCYVPAFSHRLTSTAAREGRHFRIDLWPVHVSAWSEMQFSVSKTTVFNILWTVYRDILRNKNQQDALFYSQFISVISLYIDYILITNLMHWLLFIHKIIFSSTCYEPQVLILRRIQLYTCSIWYCHSL